MKKLERELQNDIKILNNKIEECKYLIKYHYGQIERWKDAIKRIKKRRKNFKKQLKGIK